MTLLINSLIVMTTAVLMEGVAYLLHKYVMHGFLWILHEDHHRPTGRGWQKNDAFSVFFALLSMLLIIGGSQRQWWPLVSVGIGMAIYGVGYPLFHEIMFHRRLAKIRYRPRHPYLRRIVRAHREHHRHTGQKDATSFSFLYAPARFKVS